MRLGVNTLFLVPGDVGGTEIYLLENLKAMVPSNPDDVFILFTSRDNEDRLRDALADCPNTEFVQLPIRSAVRPLRIMVEQILLPWIVKKHDTDVLWSPGYTAPLSLSCPQTVTIHDLQYKSHPEDVSYMERITLDFLVRNACRRCDSVITVSEFSKNEVVRFKFAAENKIHVVHEGVDPAFGAPTGQDIKDLPGELNTAPYILCVAHTYPHKKVHVLIQAFDQIVDSFPHNLVLVGKARRGESMVLESLSESANQQRIHRIDSINYSELVVLYQNADLFVLPSEYEGFGLPVLEALLAGAPVITTDKASLPEVGGDLPLYINNAKPDTLAQAIREVLSWDTEVKERQAVDGKRWASSFTWKKSAEHTIEAIKSLVL